MQWLCLFAVLLVLSQPTEAGKKFDLIVDSVDASNAEVFAKLAEVQDEIDGLTSSCTAKIPDPEYLGCYEDKSARLLPKQLAISGLTNTKCTDACAKLGYRYAGTEYSSQCFCGNCYEKYPKKNETDCSYKCTGNDAEKCGGFWRISVSSTGV